MVYRGWGTPRGPPPVSRVSLLAQLVNFALSLVFWMILGRMLFTAMTGGRESFILGVFRKATDPVYGVVRRITGGRLGDVAVAVLALLLVTDPADRPASAHARMIEALAPVVGIPALVAAGWTVVGLRAMGSPNWAIGGVVAAALAAVLVLIAAFLPLIGFFGTLGVPVLCVAGGILLLKLFAHLLRGRDRAQRAVRTPHGVSAAALSVPPALGSRPAALDRRLDRA